MTQEEARGFIQGKLNCMKKCGVFNKEDNINYNDCDYCNYCYSQGNFGQQKEAFNMAINALEKQIAKKPKMRHLKPYDSYNDGWCPNCEAYVNEDSGNKHCPDCGQKLDWSEAE